MAMSIEAMSAVLHHSQAAGSTKLVLIGIANHQGDAGAWPAISTLARYANVSERQAQRAIRQLEELGEIKVDYQAPEMLKRTNRYWVTVRCPKECDGTTQHRVGVTSMTRKGDTDDTPRVTPMTPEPLSEPTEKPMLQKPTRIPETFVITDDMRHWAKETVPDVQIDFETESFIDYWSAKPNHATKLDWVKTWQVWMRENQKRQARRGVPKSSRSERNLELLKKIAAEEGKQ